MHVLKGFVIILLLVIMWPVCSQASQVGSLAPDFSLTDLNDKTFTLQQFRGKVVLLDFWAPWCAPCREELPHLDALYQKYNNDGLVILGIDIVPSEKLVSEFLQKVPITFTILIDRKNTVTREYRIRSLPAVFLVGKDGVIHYVHLGFGKDFLQMYEKEIIDLLQHP